MAEQQEQQSGQSQSATSSGAGGAAVKAAAAAAATGVAALAAKKALSGRQQSNGQSNEEQAGNGSSAQTVGSDSLVSSMISGSWEAAREQLLPLAEEAAGAAGEFVARNAPDVVKERIVPRFIASFNEASASG